LDGNFINLLGDKMLKSMTAFSLKTVEKSWGVLQCEIRSVNHRYCEIQIKLPDELRSLEKEFGELIAQKVKRGKLECVFRFTARGMPSSEIIINEAHASAVLTACKQLSKKLHQPSEVNPLEILNWPGVIKESKIDVQPVIDASLDLLTLTLNDFVVSRCEEGGRLKDVMLLRHQAMKNIVSNERKHQPELAQQYRDKLRQKIEEVTAHFDTDRFEQELVYLLNKMNVDEEIDRLESHFTEVENIFKRDEPVGRRLDFIMQELNREANTLGSKSIDIKTTQTSVELKVLIEQMREQVQNIE